MSSSCSTRCRWENVPRALSSPDNRTGTPSSSSDPKASASAKAQSTPFPVAMASRRLSRNFTSLGWTSTPSMGVVMTRVMCSRRSRATRVSRGIGGPTSSGEAIRSSGRAASAGSASSLDRANASSSSFLAVSRKASTSSSVTSPSPTSFRAYRVAVDSWASIFVYMMGWVNEGSSPSLWPWRR